MLSFSQLSQFQEQLDECKKYKDFLLNLTPKEWQDANNNVEASNEILEAIDNNKSRKGGRILAQTNYVIHEKEYVIFMHMNLSPLVMHHPLTSLEFPSSVDSELGDVSRIHRVSGPPSIVIMM